MTLRTRRFERRGRRARHARAGVSLLEVLISMFILLFGLTGVASLFPVGGYYASRAQRYDRTAAAGQAAFEDLQIRGLLVSNNAEVRFPTQITLVSGTNGTGGSFAMPAFAMDPFAMRTGGGPYASVWSQVGMKQLAFIGLPLPHFNGGPTPVAFQTFQSRDDLSVFFPENPDELSQQFFQTIGGVTQQFGTGNPAHRQYNGQYSWIYTVTPAIQSDEDVGSGVPPAESVVTVSVPIFHGRNVENEFALTPLLVPPELTPLGGLGGVRVYVTVNAAQHETLKVGNWVMLTNYGGVALNGSFVPDFYHWYRIQDVQNYDAVTVGLQLVGPNVRAIDIVPGPGQTRLRIAVFDQVVAVYQKSMRISDQSSEFGFVVQ